MGAFNIPLPHITASTEKEQLLQIKNYLYQMSEQLGWALNNISSSTPTATVIKQTSTPTPAPSSGKIDPESTFNAIKSLIIKSADIVDAYYEEVSKKLQSIYVAQSDFGEFREEMEFEVIANSAHINEVYTNIQTITSDIVGVYSDMGLVEQNINGKIADIQNNTENVTKDLFDKIDETGNALEESMDGISSDLRGQIDELAQSVLAVLEVNAYVKSGLLYYKADGLPVYGVEVGQTNNVDGVDVYKKFTRFTADRLSFYDQNDNEVAYISDYKLYITSVEILYSLIGGGFMLDFSRGFTLKFTGGNSQ